jgi:hypothetical protein
MTDSDTTVAYLRRRVAQFVAACDWEQFHNPRKAPLPCRDPGTQFYRSSANSRSK